jgi:hypothetical protein
MPQTSTAGLTSKLKTHMRSMMNFKREGSWVLPLYKTNFPVMLIPRWKIFNLALSPMNYIKRPSVLTTLNAD